MAIVNIHSGMVLRWVGLPGQYDNENYIRIDSLTASCKVNACIVSPDGDPLTLIGIQAADFVVAVEQGWLVPVEG
jgi:hypothetical protein